MRARILRDSGRFYPLIEELEPRLLLTAQWTVMVFMNGDNNLEDAALMNLDMMETVGSTAAVNIVCETDCGTNWTGTGWVGAKRGRVTLNGNTSGWASLGQVDMGSPAALTGFEQWAVTNYPANHYALVLWDHGGGIDGVSWDDTSGNNLSLKQVRQALAAAGTHLDILGYDACLMQMMEAAYETRANADIVVASEEVIPWDGWTYNTILSDLVSNPSQAASTWAADIVTRYSAGDGYTMSAVDETKVPALATALSNFSSTMMSMNVDWAAASSAQTAAPYFTETEFRDLGFFMTRMASSALNANDRAAAQAVMTAYNQALIANWSLGYEGGTGISIYLPAQGEYMASLYTPANFQLLADTTWYQFLGEFTSGSGGNGSSDADGTIATATVVGTLPQTPSGNIGMDGATTVGGTDVDMYAVTVSAGDTIGFDVDARETISSPLDGYLALFDSSGVKLAVNDDNYDPDTNNYTADPYLRYTFGKAGTYYIAVSGYPNTGYNPNVPGSGISGDTGAYNLLVRKLTASSVDSDGTIATAVALGAAPTSYHGTIGDETCGPLDVDFYAVNVQAGQTLTFTATAGGSGLDGYLRLFKADGTALASNDNTSGSDPEIVYDFTSLGAGTYYIAVSGSPNSGYNPFTAASGAAGSTGAYTLSIQGNSVQLDFNGTIEQATALGTSPADVTAGIGDEPAGGLDVDFYSFSVSAGQALTFTIDALSSGSALNAVMRLFNGSGVELANAGEAVTGSDPTLQYTFSSAGTYYIAISGWPNDGYLPFVSMSGVAGSTGAYTLHVRTVATVDANGTIPTATATAGFPYSITAAIGDETAGDLDVDIYSFTVTAGQQVAFNVDAASYGSGLDSILRLFSGAGTELAINDDATDPTTGQYSSDPYLSWTFATAGTYFIAVSGYKNISYNPFVAMSGTHGSTGAYTLLVTVLNGQAGPDAYGYMARPTAPYFEEISGTGTAGHPADTDDGFFQITAAQLGGFTFNFYGTVYNTVYVSANGYLTFVSGNTEYDNYYFDNFSQPTIAPLFDDLKDVGAFDTNIFWQVKGSGVTERLIVEWKDVKVRAGDPNAITFEAVLCMGDGSIQFNYQNLASGGSSQNGAAALVGIKDAGAETPGVRELVFCDNPGGASGNLFVGTNKSTWIGLAPDLSWNSASASPASVAPGGVVTVARNYQVSYSAPAGSFTVQYRLSVDKTWGNSDDVVLGPDETISLAADMAVGAHGTSFSRTVPLSVAPGSYWLLAMVDSSSSVAEWNESNNVITGNQVLVVRPDLLWTSLSATPSPVAPGGTLSVSGSYSVANSIVPASFSIEYRLSLDRAWGNDDDIVLAPDQSVTAAGGKTVGAHAVSCTVTLPFGAAAGTYYVLGMADSAANIAESNETNNVFVANTVDVVLPDLGWNSLSASPSPVAPGGTLSMTANYQVSGVAVIPSFAIQYHLSTDQTWGNGDDVALTPDQAIATGADKTLGAHAKSFSATLPTSTAPGTYYVLAMVDSGAAVTESDEANDVIVANQVSVLQPDLSWNSLSAAPSGVAPGGTLTMTRNYQVSNVAVIPGFAIQYRLSTDPTWGNGDDIVLTTDESISSASDKTLGAHGATFGATVPGGAAPGTYYVLAMADSSGTVTESDEGNNVFVGGQVTVLLTNLSWTSLTASPTAIAQGGLITFTSNYQVSNAPVASSFAIEYRLSTDQTWGNGDDLVVTPNQTLSSASDRTVGAHGTSFMVTVPGTPATYYILAQLDSGAVVAESDEGDNIFVGGQVTVALADLSWNSLSAAPTTVAAGGSLTMTRSYQVSTVAAPGAFTIQYRLSTDQTWGNADDVVLTPAETISALADKAVGAHSSTFGVTVPSGTATGTYYVLAMVDSAGAVTESSETNNVIVGNQVLVPQTDLSWNSLSLAPGSVAAGGTLTMTRNYQVSNLAAPAGFAIQYRLSLDQTWGNADDIVLTPNESIAATPDKAVGAHSTTFAATVPGGTAAGTYCVLAMVDSGAAVAEPNEANNVIVGNQVDVQPSAADRFEPNNLSWSATPLALDANGQAFAAGLSVFAAGDADWFQFTVPYGATGAVQVNLTNVGAGLKAHVGLYDSVIGSLADQYGGIFTTLYGPKQEANASSADQPVTLNWTGLKAGTTYYVKVSALDNTTGVYDLGLSVPMMAPDALESNDTLGAATNSTTALVSGCGACCYTNLSIHRSADEDWFRIDAPANTDGNLTARVSSLTGGLAGLVWIYQQYTWGMVPVGIGVYASWMPGGAGQAVVYSAQPNTTYYVRVDNFWSETGGYQLDVTLPLDAQAKDAYEAGAGNNASWFAHPLTLTGNAATVNSLSIHNSQDLDWFSFMPTSNGDVQITVSAVSGGLVAHVGLYDSVIGSLADQYGGVFTTLFGPKATQDASTANQTVTLNFSGLHAWTTYYVKVSGLTSTTGLYSLGIAFTPTGSTGDTVPSALLTA